jgi:hypothetical protein
MMLLPWPSVAEQVASPPLSALPVQPDIAALFDVNVTVPVGVPPEELTAAVKMVVPAAFDGFALLERTVVVPTAVAYVNVNDQLVIDIGLVTPFPFIAVRVHVPFALVVAYLLVSVGGEEQFTALL